MPEEKKYGIDVSRLFTLAARGMPYVVVFNGPYEESSLKTLHDQVYNETGRYGYHWKKISSSSGYAIGGPNSGWAPHAAFSHMDLAAHYACAMAEQGVGATVFRVEPRGDAQPGSGKEVDIHQVLRVNAP